MRDILIDQKLVNTYQYNNSALVEKIDNVLSLPRILDGPPPKYSPLIINRDDINPFGIYTYFLRMYNRIYTMQEAKDGSIIEGIRETKCDYETLTILKVLIVCGVSKSTERASVCREIFKLILSEKRDGKLTKDMLLSVLLENGEYYHDEVTRAILECAYTPLEQIDMRLRNSMRDLYETKMLDLFEDAKDVFEFDERVSNIYKEACSDPEFKVQRSKGKIYNAIKYIYRCN